jgi:hypothetical protein
MSTKKKKASREEKIKQHSDILLIISIIAVLAMVVAIFN